MADRKMKKRVDCFHRRLVVIPVKLEAVRLGLGRMVGLVDLEQWVVDLVNRMRWDLVGWVLDLGSH